MCAEGSIRIRVAGRGVYSHVFLTPCVWTASPHCVHGLASQTVYWRPTFELALKPPIKTQTCGEPLSTWGRRMYPSPITARSTEWGQRAYTHGVVRATGKRGAPCAARCVKGVPCGSCVVRRCGMRNRESAALGRSFPHRAFRLAEASLLFPPVGGHVGEAL